MQFAIHQAQLATGYATIHAAVHCSKAGWVVFQDCGRRRTRSAVVVAAAVQEGKGVGETLSTTPDEEAEQVAHETGTAVKRTPDTERVRRATSFARCGMRAESDGQPSMQSAADLGHTWVTRGGRAAKEKT